MGINITLIELFQSGLYCPAEIARRVGFSQGSSVVRYLKRHGVWDESKVVIGYKGNSNSRKYNVNHSFFETINSEEKAYWLGFLFADGYNTGSYRITVNLQWSDREHLENFKKCIDSSNPIVKRMVKIKRLNEVARLDVNSKKFCYDLSKLGMIRAKSLILSWPVISKTLMCHFIRGYFDGDGWITPSKTSGCVFGFCSSEKFIVALREYLMSELHLRNNQLEKAGKARVIRWSGKEIVKRFYHFLYDDASVYLHRKKETFEKLLTIRKISV